MKTTEEIKARMRQLQSGGWPDDWLGVQTNDLLAWLPFSDAREWLKDDVTVDQWKEFEAERKQPLDAIRDYLEFAWGKANDCRGISAGRSLDHIKTWLWLADFDDLVDKHFAGYSHYGKKQLVIASLLVDFDWRKHDDGNWVNRESAAPASQSFVDEQAAEAAVIVAAAKASK